MNIRTDSKKLLRDMTDDELFRTIRECDERIHQVSPGGLQWKSARNLRESCGSELGRRDPRRRSAS